MTTTRHPAVRVCTCWHLEVEHVRSRTNFPHPPVGGVCLVTGCMCREFRDSEATDDEPKAAA